jgi:hypothetical protein
LFDAGTNGLQQAQGAAVIAFAVIDPKQTTETEKE